MTFVLRKDGSQESVEAFTASWNRYRDYLASISESLPSSARDFALADWHYDFTDHRAPHDAWVESIQIFETASGERQQNRQTNIKIRLLGAYHDGHIEIEYENVFRYSITSSHSDHGDWEYDEIRISNDGHILHEIEIGGSHGSSNARTLTMFGFLRANPSVKRDWPLIAPSSIGGNLQLSGSGHLALRPASYLKR